MILLCFGDDEMGDNSPDEIRNWLYDINLFNSARAE